MDVDDEPDPREPGALLVPPAELPDEVLGFTLPSRYVDSDQVANEAWQLFGDTPPTWERVQAVCDWVHANIRYDPNAVVPHGTARQLLDRRAGVCRDFALLVTAFCRALNIPARYTFGYLPDIAVDAPDTPMDFHAWSEVFIDGRWYTFDARHNMPRVGRVVVGFGRDAADVALTTSYGALNLLKMQVWAEEVTAAIEDEEPTQPQGTTPAGATGEDDARSSCSEEGAVKSGAAAEPTSRAAMRRRRGIGCRAPRSAFASSIATHIRRRSTTSASG